MSTIIQIWIARITSIMENVVKITVPTGTEKTVSFTKTGKVVQGIQAVPFYIEVGRMTKIQIMRTSQILLPRRKKFKN